MTTRKVEAELSDSLYLIRSYNHEKRSPSRLNARSTSGPSRVGTGISSYSTRAKTKRDGLVDVNYEKAQDFEIWQVARAATAAPFYFEPMKIERALTRGHTILTDGGFGHTNNPVRDAKKEVEQRHGRTSVSTIVSVGTARKATKRKRAFFSVPGWTRHFADQATDPEKNHADMQREHDDCLDEDGSFSYFRFNDPGGLKMALDEWKPKQVRFSHAISGHKTIEAMENAFGRWASNPENTNELHNCAAELVDRRRQRMDTPKWELYATGAWYECDKKNCSFESDRDAFERHLRLYHNVLDPEELKRIILNCRRIWEYQPADASNRA